MPARIFRKSTVAGNHKFCTYPSELPTCRNVRFQIKILHDYSTAKKTHGRFSGLSGQIPDSALNSSSALYFPF